MGSILVESCPTVNDHDLVGQTMAAYWGRREVEGYKLRIAHRASYLKDDIFYKHLVDNLLKGMYDYGVIKE